jgi:hypothetical protein
MRKPKTLGHAAPLSGCVDADAVLPLLSHAEVQCKRSWRFGRGKRESPPIVRPAACRGQHSFVGFYPSAVITAQPPEKGPPLGAFCLAPHQRENQGYSERNHDYGESQQIEHEHLPSPPETSSTGGHYDRAALPDGVTAVTGVMDFLRLQRRRRFPPVRHNEDLAALRRRSPGHPVSQ